MRPVECVGKLVTMVLTYFERWDTVVVARNHTDTLSVTLRRRRVHAAETPMVAPRGAADSTQRTPSHSDRAAAREVLPCGQHPAVWEPLG
jgi:hypothetical protein